MLSEQCSKSSRPLYWLVDRQSPNGFWSPLGWLLYGIPEEFSTNHHLSFMIFSSGIQWLFHQIRKKWVATSSIVKQLVIQHVECLKLRIRLRNPNPAVEWKLGTAPISIEESKSQQRRGGSWISLIPCRKAMNCRCPPICLSETACLL